GDISPATLVEYTENANSLLFDTPVIGLEVYRLAGRGKTWVKTHSDYLDNVYFSYGYYFGQIRVSPRNSQQLYVMGVPVIRSDDGGANWRGINAGNVHSDHHALWISPDRDGHLILGNDGGINISYDNGENWIKCNHPPVGQFYYIAVDYAQPYNVYGGLQDNGVWMGKNNYQAGKRWQQTGQYPYKMIMGGDGMQVAVDPRDNETLYTGFQFGNYFRIHTPSEKRKYITPQHELGERPYRWNWQTPIHLSEHNPDVLYMGSNFVHRSLNRGDDFEKISPDLTFGGRKGDVPYGTLTALHESPLRFGLLYAGSDDGRVHISRDGGYSWQEITKNLNPGMWVSRIQASQHEEGRVYLVLNGYRWDNWDAMLYRSDDYGATWDIIGRDLPQETLNVIKEDPVREDVLYVGSDHAAYVSLDGGRSFHAFAEGLAGAPVHDIVVHPEENDLLLGTHGRSIYKGSVREIQQLTAEVMANSLHLFELDHPRRSRSWGRDSWYGDNEPSLTLPIYSKEAGELTVIVSLEDGPELKRFDVTTSRGIHYADYDLTYAKDAFPRYQQYLQDQLEDDEPLPDFDPSDNGAYYLHPGTYTVTLKRGKETRKQSFEIKG
ncbi:MAG: glycosyl hydrolase, partial [Bacteroidota bacterium]